MDAKFTPGPWEVVPIELHPYGLRVQSSLTNEVILSQDSPAWSSKQRSREDNIAGVGFNGDARSEVVSMIERQAANAKLIAAAPELYEAAVVALHQWWNDCDRLGDATDQLRDDSPSAKAYRALEAALAKAV